VWVDGFEREEKDGFEMKSVNVRLFDFRKE